jgi:hypothetical protein
VTSPLASTCVVRPNVTSRQRVRVFMIALVVGLAALAFGVAPTIAEAAKKPPPGALGVYRAAAEPSSTAAFGSWLGRQPVYALDFIAQESWKQISFPVWWTGGWEGSRYRIIYSIPMLPTDTTSTLKAGARGDYNKHFKKIARILVDHGQANAVIRLGWEMNGDWFQWSARGNEAAFVTYWRNVVRTMRAVEGTNFKFDWSPVFGPTAIDPETVYPGDAYVDYIGMSVFDQGYFEGWQDPDRRWHEMVLGFRYGLLWHRDFAAQHKKKIAYPEWGVIVRNDGHGGGDNPKFIKRMYKWLHANKANIAYHVYFDPKPGTFVTTFPKSASTFRRLFARDFPRKKAIEPRLATAAKRQIQDYSGLSAEVRGLRAGQKVSGARRVIKVAVTAPLGIRRTVFRVDGKVVCVRRGDQKRRCKLPALPSGTHSLVVTVTDGHAWTVQEIISFRVV